MARMRQLIITGILALAFACFYSCDIPDDRPDVGFVYTINLDNVETTETAEEIPVSKFCDSVEITVLETSKDVLLQWIDKVVRVNNVLYVLDRRSNLVAGFTMDGRFVRRYGNVGRGPGEYIRIADFAVNGNGNKLYLLDSQSQKLLTYALDSGKYLEETILGDRIDKRSGWIASVGDLLYADLNYWEFDESNYMFKSWNNTDP